MNMNTSSLLITLVGIIVIIGLYLMSRLALSKQPQIQKVNIPTLKNDDGSKFSSILEDIAAQDGSTPKSVPLNKVTITNTTETKNIKDNNPHQIILFISADDENGLNGNLVEKSLQKNKLKLGDKDIYHYYSDHTSTNKSLFRVANGTAPWTLNTDDLHNKKLAGLSLFMLLPEPANRKEAINTLLKVSKIIATDINGTLKNDKQQILTNENENELLSL